MARLGTLAGGLLFGAALSLLAACGGGGDGGGGAGSGAGAAETPVVYAGSTNPAVISGTNASKLTIDVVAGDESASVVTGVSIVGGSAAPKRASDALHLAWRFSRALRGAAGETGQFRRLASGVQVNDTEPCDGGKGSSHTVGTLNDASLTGTVIITFNACLIGSDVLNGKVTQRVDSFHGGGPDWPRDSTVSFTRLTIRGPSLNVDVSGALRIEQNGPEVTETITENVVTFDNLTGRTTKSENLRFAYTYNNWFSPTSILVSVDGRLFDELHGYVDIATSSRLHYGTWDQLFPDAGVVTLVGAGGASARVEVLSLTMVRLGLDLDGSGSQEISAVLKWTELSGPVGEDLADDDADGLHNSWEVANGLTPNDGADSGQDPDGDGATTWQEYQAGTDPRDAASKPPSVDIAVTMSHSPVSVGVGGDLTYAIRVWNAGTSATDVIMTDTLPPAVSLSSVITGQGSCSGAATVTCNLGTIAPFANVEIFVRVVPSAEGTLENTVTVATSAFEEDLTDNSATVHTSVFPTFTSLHASMTDAPGPVLVGANATYTVSVSNPSTTAAENVVLTSTTPAEFLLVSAVPTLGSCSGTASLTCNLGTVEAFGGSRSVTIVVTALAQGVVDYTVSISSSTPDSNPNDNTATRVTTIGQSASLIQELMNGAGDGEVVSVPAGIYIGSLTFTGKNVIVQSIAGPAGTTIHANGGRAVEIGPGGTFKGFTVTGAREAFGAGMRVEGSGSLISGNVFVGGTPGGTAIEGNSASPTIERNVFRGHNCGNTGVVAFVNGSSPLIVNNVFENNACTAIDLTLPEGQAPKVVNNTFFANYTAIRLDRRVPQITQTYRNNVLYKNGIGLDVVFGTEAGNPVWTNNLVYDNAINYRGILSQAGVNGNIAAAPMFVDFPGGDYRLMAGSPAIDAGSATDAPGVDFGGVTRPQDGDGNGFSAVDIGAFEALP